MENYSKLAEFLGLQLSDAEELHPFTIVTDSDEEVYKTCKITVEGILFLTENDVWQLVRPSTYVKLVNDTFKVKEEPFIPKEGDIYFYYSLGEVFSTVFDNSQSDFEYFFTGNCFKTEEAALAKGESMVERLKVFYNSFVAE